MNFKLANKQHLYIVGGILAGIFFFWSRLDFSSRIYYFGDGNVVVELIRLMLASGDWDPNWFRVAGIITQQPEAAPVHTSPAGADIFYNLSGYILAGTALCKTLYTLGFNNWPIPSILRGFNIAIQMATVLLLFLTGRKLFNVRTALLAVLLFVVFPLVVMEAHYERPEPWLGFLLCAVVYCCAYFHEAPARYSVFIGILLGLSVATKINQLFLLLLPGLLLIHHCFTAPAGSMAQKTRNLFGYGTLVFLFSLLTIYVHAPFLIVHPDKILEGLQEQTEFYTSLSYPYSGEYYSFANQLLVSFRYFWFTLGSAWCLFFVIGFIVLIREYLQNPTSKKIIGIILVMPIVVLFIFSAMLSVFTERSLSSLEGVLCLVTAAGFMYSTERLLHTSLPKPIMPALIAMLLLFMLFTPLRINYLFVDRYIHHADKPPRVLFQEKLKHDFQKFWIKNIYFALKVRGELPDKPGKAPRLYQIDDLNEHWTKNYLALLERSGFRKVATYCSEFSDLPPNTLTVYHAAAKNHYYVRLDEWPAELSTNYFKTNCP